MKSNSNNNNKVCKLLLNGFQLEYILKRSSRKSIGISIDKFGKVTVSVPNRLPEAAINEVVIKKASWISDKLTKIKALSSDVLNPREFRDGDTFFYLGETYKLKLIEDRQLRKTIVRLGNDGLEIYTGASDEIEKIRDGLKRWYVEQFIKILEERVLLYSQQLGVKPGRLTIREQKTRWGSCSSKGNLNFNWKLIMAPLEVLDYVVIHELCHMKEMNHSVKFWTLVQSICPHYKEYRKWLKDNGSRLSIE